VSREQDRRQAQAFDRRRTRAAFVAGPSGEADGDAFRPLRLVVGGGALALVLLVGSVVDGLVSGRMSVGWGDHGPVVSHRDPHATSPPTHAVGGALLSPNRGR
jgi:hypothetical protein